MPKKKPSGAREWVDPDDAPELDDDFFDRAEIRQGDKIIRRGRPPLGLDAKRSITIRLDADVVDTYRSKGRGWQTQVNADLRKALKLKTAKAS